MMGFRKVPIWLLFSPLVSELTSFQRDFLMFAQLARDARNCLPYDAALLRSVVFPGRPFVGLREIAAARDHLVASGVFLYKMTTRKEWLEIAQEYRNNDGENETSFGEEERAPIQGELTFAPRVVSGGPLNRHSPNAQPAESRREQNRRSTAPESLDGRQHPDPDDHNNDVERWGVSELEGRARACGADLSREDRNWRQKCEKAGWSQDEKSWRLWLIRLLERKPRPRESTKQNHAQMPEGWEEFTREKLAANMRPADSYRLARGGRYPQLIGEFEAWKREQSAPDYTKEAFLPGNMAV